MFWLVIIAIIAGTYYIVKWGKKKAEQQAQQDADQERQAQMQQAQMQGRQTQPPAPSPATPLPPLPFDPSKGHVTAQLAGEIGRWSESDATAALGAPTKSRPPRASGEHQDEYTYVDSAGVPYTFALSFKDGRLTGIGVSPQQGLSYEEVKQALGEPIPHPEWAQFEATMGDPTKHYDYGNMQVNVDQTGAVKSFGIRNASAAAHFFSGASWTTRVP